MLSYGVFLFLDALNLKGIIIESISKIIIFS